MNFLKQQAENLNRMTEYEQGDQSWDTLENMVEVNDSVLTPSDLKVIYSTRNEILQSAKMPNLFLNDDSSD